MLCATRVQSCGRHLLLTTVPEIFTVSAMPTACLLNLTDGWATSALRPHISATHGSHFDTASVCKTTDERMCIHALACCSLNAVPKGYCID